MNRKKPVTENTLRVLIQQRVHEIGSLRSAAKVWGMSPAYLGAMLQGRSPLNDRLLELVGYERQIVYRRRVTNDQHNAPCRE